MKKDTIIYMVSFFLSYYLIILLLYETLTSIDFHTNSKITKNNAKTFLEKQCV